MLICVRNMQKILTSIKKVNLYKAMTIAPIVSCGFLIILFAVNVPLLDQWEIVPMVKHIKDGNFYWNDFWLQHNEHRVLIPNLILTASALLTKWDLIVECLLGFITAIASFFLLLRLVDISAISLKRKVPKILPVILSIIWFSAVQLENWLWGWQLEWFLNIFAVVLVVYSLARMNPKKLRYQDYCGLVGGALLAQLTLGSGTLIWFILLAGMLYRGVPWKKVLLPAAVGLVTTFAYYYQYITPTYPSKTLFLHEPLHFMKYVFIYLGRPLTFLHFAAPLAGALLLALFVGLNVLLISKYQKQSKQLAPILLLGWYAVGAACMTSISRMGFGSIQAYSSRYITIAMLILVSIVIIFAIGGIKFQLPGRISERLFTNLVVLGLLYLLGLNYAWGLHGSIGWKRNLNSLKDCMGQTVPTNECLLRTYPNADVVRERLEYIKQEHMGGY
jgi:hypothetical protein